jgi:excisionase family DNA binding protein
MAQAMTTGHITVTAQRDSRPRRYLSPAEVAEQLGISLRQVRRHIASGELPASRIGSSHLLRIRAEDVDALLQPVVPPSVSRH